MSASLPTECAKGYFDPVTECTKSCNCRETSEECDKEIGKCVSGCPDGFYEEDGCQRACPSGKFGINCSETCGNCQYQLPCNKSSGYCPSEVCAAHWKPPMCDECADNFWDSDCKKQCGHCLNGAVCDKEDGTCPNGCDANWQGARCDECLEGKWGLDCASDCGSCVKGTCSQLDGTCQCLPHWTAPFCLDCIDGFYDDNCSSVCGKCKDGAACNTTTGICQDGCRVNWLPELCQECVDGLFGESCSTQCKCRTNSEICNKNTGYCTSGCADGQKPPNCIEECDNGKFGTNCSSHCGHCKGGQPCDKVTGVCVNGCEPNFNGKTCVECKDGMYGRVCNNKCGKCKDNAICDKKTGNCPKGCVIGMKEGLCSEACDDGTHGEGCKLTCGNCAGNDACDKSTGACPQACQDGWETMYCNKQQPKSSMMFVAVGIAAAILLLFIILIIVFLVRRRSAEKESRLRLRDDFHNNTIGREITGLENRAAVFNVNPVLDLKDEFDDTDDDNNYEEERGTVDMDNVYVNNVNKAIDVSDLRYTIERKTTKDEFSSEFQMLPKGLTKKHDVGTRPANKKKNRFLAIYPYDDTRVKLPTLTGDETSTYINANYIQGYKQQRKYIATQGCLPHTINDFWRMMWDVKARRIVMLTSLAEGGKIKCSHYWPDLDKKVLFNTYQIHNKQEIRRSDYTIRIFEMTERQSGDQREILQFHFTSWPDHGVPSVPALLYFYRLVKLAATEDEGPLVTHCSAGVGRTGTFLGLDAMLEQASVENKINVFKYVTAMREDRVNMVQTKCQYIFLHHVLYEALISKNTFYTTTRFEEVFSKGVALGSDLEKQLKKEHQNLLALRQHLSPEETKAALAPENIIKNRWADRYLPADEYRVFLTTPVKGTTSYINAVSLPSIAEAGGYITTQMPLEETVVDFWRMIYGMDVQSIVSADPSVAQNGLPDFGVYWPEENEELLVSPFKIRCTSISICAEDVLEYNLCFKLQTKSDLSEEKFVKLFVLNCWPKDTLVPRAVSPILSVLETVNQRQTNFHNPIVFQCLNGISRSGMLSAASLIISRLKMDKEIDIFSTIRQIQIMMPEAISTYEQYKFCYTIATRCLDSMKVYSNL
ncbi:receptor-type tyrosine-protein phosphatase alpha [Patella vulgata]|uniref:receptor-type tyrosine-protein phosphatase alpha n=1 Tax=Patella vulgata TaxID=6465 RepID=UPI00217F4A6D|nr:receptor-type tyrosine-protein phosphatase alpha [Patella vulgata]